MNIQNVLLKVLVEHCYEIIPSHVNDGIPCCNTFIFWQRVTFWLSNLDKSNVGISNYMPIILWIIQNCHANISQICNIHNHIFLSTFKQKVREGKLCRYYKSSLKMFMIKHFQPCTDSIDYTKKIIEKACVVEGNRENQINFVLSKILHTNDISIDYKNTLY